MVEVKNLTKVYGNIKAVDDLSFSVDSGEILGFLGENGAGKSTTMNIITGYLSPTSGSVCIDGCDMLKKPKTAKSKIGYLPEIPPLYIDMTVIKYLEFMFELKKVKLPKKEHIKEVMAAVKINDVKNRIIKNLSKGYRQRIGIAQALLGNPPVLIFDEPTVGLDPKQIIETRKLIKALGKKHTIIFSSHVLSEVSAICDRIIVINSGQIAADAKTQELSNILESEGELLIEAKGSQSTILSIINNIDGVKKVVCTQPNLYTIEHDIDTDIRESVFKEMAKADCPILMMKKGGLSLEESFLKLTAGSKKEEKHESDN